MSRLRLGNGDDPPDAAHKMLLDAAALLLADRADGAAYLSGYVVECALKSLWLNALGTVPADVPWKKGAGGHDLVALAKSVSTLAASAGPQIARYFKASTAAVPSSAIGAWDPIMRYRPESFALTEAQDWWKIADEVFGETIAQMRLDGVL